MEGESPGIPLSAQEDDTLGLPRPLQALMLTPAKSSNTLTEVSQTLQPFIPSQPPLSMGTNLQQHNMAFEEPETRYHLFPSPMQSGHQTTPWGQHFSTMMSTPVSHRSTISSPFDFDVDLGLQPIKLNNLPCSPVPQVLRQHPEGVYCVDNEGHRTSPRRAERDAKAANNRSKSVTKTPKSSKSLKPVVDKPKGKGSRSGKNARSAGASDDEIASLTDKEKKSSKIVVPASRRRWSEEEKGIIVDFIVKTENWARVTMNLKELCVELSQHFNNIRSVEQVRQCWMNIWSMYKAAVRKQKHTGGGDGDELTFPVDFDDASMAASDASDEEDGELKKKKAIDEPKKPKRQPSGKTIDDFAKSSLFDKIDAVAFGRPDVVREQVYSSHRSTEDIDTDVKADGVRSQKRKHSEAKDMDELLTVAVRSFGERREESAHIDKKRLMMEEERFMMEQRKMNESAQRDEARLEIERERNAREAEDAKQRRLFETLKKYHELKQSDDALDQALARKMANDIAKAEGLEYSN